MKEKFQFQLENVKKSSADTQKGDRQQIHLQEIPSFIARAKRVNFNDIFDTQTNFAKPTINFQTFAIYPDFDKDTTNGFCPRYSNWNDTTCQGLMKRWICNFAMGDAPSALTSGCIWMNKFDLHIDSQAVVCIREYLVR